MLEFKNVSKIYKTNQNEEFIALNDFSYTFKNKGMYFIEGKSGSGKSTFCSLAALFDSPSKGEIYFKGKDINKWNKKKIDIYHSSCISVIFQHYNLLIEEDVLFNVCLPSFAIKSSKEKIKKRAKELLLKVGLNENQFKQKTKNLSGGEMQRVAIARALINDPDIIIADEPTGALDNDNSVKVMEILKNISKEKLVIIISHNHDLVEKYADYKIILKDGKQITKHETIKLDDSFSKIKYKKNHDDKWIIKSALKRIKRNKTKNILVFASLLFSFSFLVAMIGFVQGATYMSNEISYNKVDYNVATLSYTETKHINNSSLSLKKMRKISKDELLNMQEIFDAFHIVNSYDYLIPSFPSIKIVDLEINDICFSPIYSFEDSNLNQNLLIEGTYPSNNKGVVINSLANEKLKKILNLKTSIGQIISLNIIKELDVKSYENINLDLKETFAYDKSFLITGVVDEFTFLSVPKIFYSLKQLEEEMQINIMPNLSYYLNREITYYDFIDNARCDSEITSYMHYVFYKFNDLKKINDLIVHLNELYEIEIYSESVVTTQTFNTLMEAAIFGVSLFVLLALVGGLLILGISSYSSYVFEKRNTAIMYAFGINKNQVSSIFLFENFIIGTLAFLLSLFISPFLINGLNHLIYQLFSFSNLIFNPLQKANISTLFIIICAFFVINILIYLCTIAPIEIGGKVNIKEELNDE